jgi:hypothetical protein
VNFTNSGSTGNHEFVALTPNFPTAKVVPVDLSSPDVGGKLVAQQGAVRLDPRKYFCFLHCLEESVLM